MRRTSCLMMHSWNGLQSLHSDGQTMFLKTDRHLLKRNKKIILRDRSDRTMVQFDHTVLIGDLLR